ncbi:carbohydrate ABC transporter membrane protein 2 (CUT1 family) [Saccharopolyspora erythraea NRRL 2338]|uniref:Multiple sugar transport system permease protein n=2 Tax=Saccharopolyspora erythraea TaxID=1836 RepID=A4FN11_SACEN|nr:carbohydrate ABC transporter permease [Saccharopolyspora erythraea]EQD82581.1 sugar ABC transporter permease [Saccharopolyspora erythraea D]PFG99079.1 carbohydrate ABC transporter membrane protein 2 (CUT1 family) [Saccharopolyspora erythraea NRRL 2338]QRK89040.1 carbohydrate ABC transporter permease [Saccharopolyspora erythraea]CAM05436.1 putative multiple sugar transport system permease protein [Saccharopolyspora erythraea NRRL 2338]
MTRRRGARRIFNLVNLGALVLVVATAAPLYWMVVNSLKGGAELGATPPTPWPSDPTVDNYVQAFAGNGFGGYLVNSLVVSVVSTVVVVSLATFAGYALARLPMRGRRPLMIALLMISVFPAIAVVTPLYLVERQLGLLNSHLGLIIPYVAFNLPLAIWIMRNYMLGVPTALEDAATVDGASPTRTVLQIVVPVVRPGILTAAIFTFTATWTEFLMALTFNSQNDYRTIPVGISLFGSSFEVPHGTIFAAAVSATAPIAILVLVFRRSVVSGLASGAVKG